MLWCTILFVTILQQSTIACSSFDNLYNMQTPATTFHHTLDLAQDFAIGVWVRFIPTSDPSFSEITEGFEQQMVFAIKNTLTNDYRIALVSTTDRLNEFQGFKIYIYTNMWQQQYIRFDDLSFEGQWTYFYICVEAATKILTTFTFMDGDEDSTIIFQAKDFTLSSENLVIDIQTKSTQFNPYISKFSYDFVRFRGTISQLEFRNQAGVYFNNIPDFLAYKSTHCPFPVLCTSTQTIDLIKDTQEFTRAIQIFSLQYKLSAFTISGWAKIDPFNEISTVTKTLMRVTLLPQYGDDSAQGDRVFLFIYQQSNIPELNGIFFSTTNLEFADSQFYVTQVGDKWSDYSSFYQVAITKWHFFQFQHGLSDPKSNTQLYIYFSHGDVIKIKNFSNKRYFTDSLLYFSIGGDQYSVDYFIGSIGLMKFRFCNSADIENINYCHYSCKTCNGPTASDCLTCFDNSISHRTYVSNNKACLCDYSYLDYYGKPNCQSVLDDFNFVAKTEISIPSNEQCEYGNFIYNNQCIKCPIQVTNTALFCADCYINSKSWYLNPICSIDYEIYDYASQSIYTMRVRDESELEYYLIDKEKLTVALCPGCKGVKVVFSDDSIKVIQLSETIDVICKNGYRVVNNFCVRRDEHCLIFNDTTQACTQCLQGFTYNSIEKSCSMCPIICPKCEFKNEKLQCLSCPENHYLSDGQCNQCGQFCSICVLKSTYLKCYRCIDDKQYYLSFDGVNCLKNEISNCEYAIQLKNLDASTYESSIDLNFVPTTDLTDISTYCGLCNQGFTNYQKESKCENLGSSATQSIIDLYGDSVEIISDTSNSLLFQGSNCFNNNCASCIKNYLRSSEFCIFCYAGYYANQFTGFCSTCPSNNNCATCIQQHKIYKDAWKRALIPYYYFYINDKVTQNHHFSDYVITNFVEDYEIVCQSCKSGYTLVNEQCIKSCPDNCFRCELIENAFSCVECPNTIQGQIQSLDQNQCLQCPYNCALCRAISVSEYSNTNFDPDYPELLPYANKCLKSLELSNLQYDSQISLFPQCQSGSKCMQSITIPLNVYCSDADYSAAFSFLVGDAAKTDFLNRNIKLSEVFSSSSTTHFSQIETKIFIIEMNKQIIKQAIYSLTLQYDSLGSCVFPPNSFIDTKLSKNIYSLMYVIILTFCRNQQLELIGDIEKTVIFQDKLEIKSFTSIKIINLNILRQYAFTIQLTNTFDAIFDNLKISDQTFTNQLSSQIIILNSKKIIINNIDISNINLINTDGLFSYTYSQTQDITISMENIKIVNSVFQNSKFFNFQSNSINQIINIQSIIVESTKFIQSSLIVNSYTGLTKSSQVTMIQLNFKLLSVTNSVLIYLTGMISQQINQISIDQSQLDNSIILNLNIFDIADLIFTNNIMTASQLMSNVISTSFVDANSYSLINILIEQNTYTKYRVFLDIRQQSHISTIVTIDQIQIISNNLNYDGNSESMLADFSNFYIQADTIIMTNVLIVRGLGYPEFTFTNSHTISIFNFESYLDPAKFIPVLNYNSDCSDIIPEIYTTLIFITHLVQILQTNPIKTITFEQINIHDLIIVNQALIVLISEDKVSHTNQETLLFQNSQFKQVIMIITKLAQQQSIIFIQSEQSQTIEVFTIQFQNNIQHVYIQDISYKSSSTILIKNPLSYVLLKDSIFDGNQVTNSKDSNLVTQSQSLTIQNCKFLNTNQFNIEILYKYLIWGSYPTKLVYLEEMNIAFPIQTQGGNGFLIANQIYIFDSYIEKSISQIGGAFKFQSKGNGDIQIINTIFKDCKASFGFGLASQAGSFLIDASESDLNLIIQNVRIINSKSRGTGGAIYIIPSSVKSIITFNNVTVSDTYAINSQFLQIDEIQSTTVILKITFQGVNILNSEEGYNEFLGSIDSFSASELANYASNTLITVYNGIFLMQSSGFNGVRQSGILSLQNMESIQIKNTHISNIVLGVQNLMYLKLSGILASTILLDSVSFLDIKQDITISTANCNYPTLEKYVMLCFKGQPVPNMLYSYYSSQTLQDIMQCNLQQIQSYRQNKYPLLSISQITSSHFLSLSKMEMQLINCPNCINGLISISEIDVNSNKNLVQFSNIVMQNNYCGKLSCIVIQNSYSYKLSRLLQEQARYQKQYTFYMTKSNFQNNHGTIGGVMYIENVDTMIYSCIFNGNMATQIAGAIYFTTSTSQLFNIYDSVVSKNYAQVGGGIYLNNQILNPISSSGLLMTDNVGTFYGANFIENPQSLAISSQGKIFNKYLLTNTTDSILELISIKPYQIGNNTYNIFTVPSGQKLSEYSYFSAKIKQFVPANLTLRLQALNAQNQAMKNLLDTTCTIAAKIMDIGPITNQEPFFDNYTDPNIITFNSSTQDYNLDDLTIKFDPDLNGEKKLQLKFTCNLIKIPVFSTEPPYLIEKLFDNYTLLMNFQTYKCKSGEYKKSEDGTCLLCDASADQFTVRAGEKCNFKDQISMKAITSARVKLRPEYWRPYETNILVEQCKNLPINCNGGWEPGNDSCFEGHIGALCEQCDIYNIRGGGAYSISTIYKCGSCSEVGGNINKIVLISVWTLISIMMSVTSTMDAIELAVIGKMFARFGLISYNPWQGMGGILIKVLTNYFQIIGTITTFQLALPSGLSIFFSSVGSPIEAMSYSLDCFLATLAVDSDIEMLYFRVIWGIMMPLMYITIFFVIYGIGVLAEKARKSFSAITTTFIYMYIYLQPTLIGSLISLVSFRQISGFYWVQGNVSYRYDTVQHAKWLTGFVVPTLLFLTILIPLYMFYSIFRIRWKLDALNNKKSWGYLYNEYRQPAYFWEIVKIIQKGSMIIFLTFYEDQIVIKAALIFIIVYVYSLLSKKYTPYEFNFLNTIDYESTLICGFSIVLGMTIYSAAKSDNQEVVWPFYILLITFNAYFCSKLGYYILFAQLEIQQDNLDKIRNKINEKFPNLKNKSYWMKRLLTNRAEQRKRVKAQYMKIKKYLFQVTKEVSKIKKEHQMMSSLESEPNEEFKKNARVYPEQIGSGFGLNSPMMRSVVRLKVEPQIESKSEIKASEDKPQLIQDNFQQQQQQEQEQENKLQSKQNSPKNLIMTSPHRLEDGIQEKQALSVSKQQSEK